MIRAIDMTVLLPRSLELQQINQNAINARSDIKQEAFSQMLQEKTVSELKQVTKTNQSEQQQFINKDGRNGAESGNAKKSKKRNKKEKIIDNQNNIRPRRRNTYDSMLDIKI